MHEHTLFSTLQLDGVDLKDCELVYDENDYRMYVNRLERGFDAIAVEFCSSSTDFENVWDCPELQVINMFQITAYFDGVRHLHTNPVDSDPEMVGYLYYPDIKSFIEMFQIIRKIELEVCRDCEK